MTTNRQPLVITGGPFTDRKCDAIAEAIEADIKRRAGKAAVLSAQVTYGLGVASSAAAAKPTEKNIEALLKAAEESIAICHEIVACFGGSRSK
ncbi:MAG: hypothetical protein V2A71_10500 [Candidatus Eisenbacteria bacterium]